ncbi:D-alanyl-D-alanine carboxypeptidase/D-alanyl-D-alanine-endopeptidase [Aliiroseovarius crassostreae]|uniref:D-alanyl-D-alanine carboxypeptidase/D-alanyl-D-alanine endopeptidase n=1 Tax=Aliiroseovarius crassostreae TaxID=154981 RepID=UPI0021AFA92F|nr:D-alanyl-D-alanine carboxypeptidase/D-alanyl-D-alanine-endopeptidase [Aliiroseovarius crassostreae]UWQ02574.1 D-alanyl-D-alanine carboxypeptidase/D-alanyl-D-alanine-endopeptidase [Aliiroseovarius crassostreae]
MKTPITRRGLLAGLGGGIVTAALSSTAIAEAPAASPVPKLRPGGAAKAAIPSLEALLEQAKLSGKVGFVVADARSGLVLEARNADLGLPPASVAKAVTTAYGLAHLGQGHRFSTRVLATGPVSGSRLKGDLVLVGGADPSLDTNALEGLVKALKKKGITRVDGKFLFYENALPYQRSIDPDQPDHLGYNPSVSGLNLNYNRVHFEWKRTGESYSVAMDARSDRVRPAVSTARMQVVNRDLPVYTYKASAGIDNWTVARGALGKGGSRWLPVRRPGLYAADVFQVLARAHGIALPKPGEVRSLPGGTVLAEHRSADLATVSRKMLKYSTNLTAEVVGLSASKQRGGKPRTLAESGKMMSDWVRENLGAKSVRFADHSGLSDASRLPARDMVSMLVKLGPDGALHGLMKEITPRGKDGKKLAGAGHAIRAKTGTLNFVSALSGYVTTADGTTLAFAIFSADMGKRRAVKRADRERPAGAKSWSARARWLQHQLISRWAALYGT